jgi:glycogen debranching enzyme
LHPAYNPFAYHLGAVWPSFNAVAAYGLKRYGFRDHFLRVADGLFDAAQVFDLDRLPEVFGGHSRDARHPHPGLYPGACSPQAWSAGAIVLLVDCMLGLTPMASRKLLVVDPLLPPWLTYLDCRNIRVAESRISLRLRQSSSGGVDVDRLEADGLRVSRLRDLPSGRDRLHAAMRSAVESGLTDILA